MMFTVTRTVTADSNYDDIDNDDGIDVDSDCDDIDDDVNSYVDNDS